MADPSHPEGTPFSWDKPIRRTQATPMPDATGPGAAGRASDASDDGDGGGGGGGTGGNSGGGRGGQDKVQEAEDGDGDGDSDSDSGASTKSKSSIMVGDEGGDTDESSDDGNGVYDELKEHASRQLGDLTGTETTFAKDGAPTYVPVDVSSPSVIVIVIVIFVEKLPSPSIYFLLP